MEASTTIRKMIAGNNIFVPSYQRAYSWDSETDPTKAGKQTNTFLSDLDDFNKSASKTPYYFGHFLFEEKRHCRFGVIDGQQRLSTIVIFLAALFSKLKASRTLTFEETEIYSDIIVKNFNYKFETVHYDNSLFRDYVINQIKKDDHGLETQSAKRIVKAFKLFNFWMSDKSDYYLTQTLKTIEEASCTTHIVKDEAEATQMFIFQNNRGKRPSNLEVIKAKFMFNAHLFADHEKEDLLSEIKQRFEEIYMSIAQIEARINEDDVLLYTMRVHFNSLWENNPLERIDKLLAQKDSVVFIRSFTNSLATSFRHLKQFFGEDCRSSFEVHSLSTLGGLAIAAPFVIKSYIYNLSLVEKGRLCKAMESMVLRHRLIGTRADLVPRINDVYKSFNESSPDINPIIARFQAMKTTSDQWLAHWNDSRLSESIQGAINASTARYLLWKYENFLEGHGKGGYALTRYDKIISPELEHIAPRTPTNNQPVAAGYPEYDEEFRKDYIDCLGNYLLISKSHNCSVGNSAFSCKLDSYNYLAQQRELQKITEGSHIWSKELINERHKKITTFVLSEL